MRHEPFSEGAQMPTRRRRAVHYGLANLPVFTGEQRTRILRHGVLTAGPGTVIEEGIKVRGSATLTLGRGCYVNNDAYFDCEADVVVGDFALLAVGVTVLTSEHELQGPDHDAAYGPPVARPVTIGTQVWLGARVIVLPGVTIGDDCVVGAGAVVTRSCPPGGVYAGVPARRIRDTPHGAGRYEAASDVGAV